MRNQSMSPDNVRMISAICYAVLHVSGLFCCGLVIFLTFHAKLYKTKVNLLLANVTFAELLFNVVALTMQTPVILAGDQGYLCSIVGMLIYVTGLEAIIFVPVLAVNRYLAIFHQEVFKKVFTSRNIIIIIMISWVFVTCASMPFFITGRTGYEHNYENCGINNEDSTLWTNLVIALVVAPTILGDVLTGFCNFRIFFKLRDHVHNNTLANNKVAQNKQLMWLTFLHTLSAVCLQTPYIFGKLVPIIVMNNVLGQLFPALYTLNGTVAPLLTLSVVKPYQNAAKQLFSGKKVAAVVPLGSDARTVHP